MALIKRMTLPRSALLFISSGIFLFLGLPSKSPVPVALAEPVQGPNGQSCKSTGTTTVNGTQDGKAVKCTADYCTYDECETSGPNIGKCSTNTHYVNVRDCHAAMTRIPPKTQILPGQLAPPTQGVTKPPIQRAPIVPNSGAIMPRGVEGEQAEPMTGDSSTPAPEGK